MPSARSRTVTGLRNGTLHTFRVAAFSSVGQSAFTPLAWATPRTVPSVPRSVTATPAGYTQVVLRWAAPASTGGPPITAYRISYAPAGGAWTGFNVMPSARSRTFTGLNPGTTYYFRVAAHNAIGRSTFSTAVHDRQAGLARAGRRVRSIR